jgi:DNA-binding transcriptional MerR regulator
VTWTLEQLAELAARALVDAEVRVANGRVTGVPDGRLIRWYTTIGLLDRPMIGGPGRVARYGPRHLLQLVAVKRLQAQGEPLAEIQVRLAGATDTVLRRIAALPPGLDDPGTDAAMFRGPRRRSVPDPAPPSTGVSAETRRHLATWPPPPPTGAATEDHGFVTLSPRCTACGSVD